MTVEIPELKRCCFCLPLRPGLLACGYIKLVAGALIIPILAFGIIFLTMMFFNFMDGYNATLYMLYYVTIPVLALILLTTDFLATMVFIYAGHKKDVSLIRRFYKFSIWELIVSTLLILVIVGSSIIKNWVPTTEYLVNYAFYLVVLVVKAYFVLLLRSEVIKLKSSGQFRYMNKSAEAEAQCLMSWKQNEAEIETV